MAPEALRDLVRERSADRGPLSRRKEWGRTSQTAETAETAWIVRHALRTLRKGGG